MTASLWAARVDDREWDALDATLDAADRDDFSWASHYQSRARAASGDAALTVRTEADPVDGPCYDRQRNEILLTLFEVGDEHSFDDSRRRWLAHLEGQFWHELAHKLYSHGLTVKPPDARAAYALNLLEDLRIERRLLDEHPAVRPWLRSTHLDHRDADSVLLDARGRGWAATTSVFCGRFHSGVVEFVEVERVCSLDPGAAHFTVLLDPIWRAFAALGDNEMGDQQVIELAQQLAEHLPPSIRLSP